MKSYILTILAVLVCLNSYSQEILIDNVYYQLEEGTQTAIVLRPDSNFQLERLKIPSSIKIEGKRYTVNRIASAAFNRNSTLKKVILPSSVSVVDSFAFAICPNLEYIKICNNTFVGEGAFMYCKKLKRLKLPQNQKTVPNHICLCCWNLEHVRLPKHAICIEELAFDECLHLKSVRIPNGVRVIDFFAFKNCWELKTIRIPASMDTLNSGAFLACKKLRKMRIDGPLKYMQNSVFYGCAKLREIRISAPIPPKLLLVPILEGDIFDRMVYQHAQVFVPKGSAELYKNTKGWNLFEIYKEK